MFPPCRIFCLLNVFLSTTNTDAASEVTGYVLTSSITIYIPIQRIADPSFSASIVNLRIEANSSTLWEGPIKSGPRNITVSEGPDLPYGYPCDGRDNYPDRVPGPTNTALDALDEASKLAGFTYDGEFFEEDEDFAIYRIGAPLAKPPQGGWAVLVNYEEPAPYYGLNLVGCHDVVKAGDDVLWAVVTDQPGNTTPWAYGLDLPYISFLKLTPKAVTVKRGKGTTVTVIDGRTGNKTHGASVAGVKTDTNGKATLYFSRPGFYQFKAHRTGDVRSNVINITVTS